MPSPTNVVDKSMTGMDNVAYVEAITERQNIAVGFALNEAASKKTTDNGPVNQVADDHTSPYNSTTEDDFDNSFIGDGDTTLMEEEEMTSTDISAATLGKKLDEDFSREEFHMSAGLTLIARESMPRGRTIAYGIVDLENLPSPRCGKSILRNPSWILRGDDLAPSSTNTSVSNPSSARSTSSGMPSKERKRVSFNESATIFHIDRKDVTDVEQLPVDQLGVLSGHFLKHKCVELPEDMRERVKRARERSPHPVLRAQSLREGSPPSHDEPRSPTSAAMARQEMRLDVGPVETSRKRRRMRSSTEIFLDPESTTDEVARDALTPTPSPLGSPNQDYFAEAPCAGRPKGLPSDIRKMMVPKLQRPRPSRRMGEPKKRRAPIRPFISTVPVKSPREEYQFLPPLDAKSTGDPTKPPIVNSGFDTFKVVAHPDEIRGRSGHMVSRKDAEKLMMEVVRRRKDHPKRGSVDERVIGKRNEHKEKKYRLKLKNLNSASPTLECVPRPLGLGPDGNPVAPPSLHNAIKDLHRTQKMYEEALKMLDIARDMKKNATRRALDELKDAHETYGEPQDGFYYPVEE
ncbi:uncharacterized protein BDZ99DRAFT_474437 [Mytilinidion resinicola]|uniref:Uncharacterized protein n=1 Tax=Mytilinidion resinicola TaxID=574789 RepID=A0A6A6YTI3_9PEZI|nr:uncharacterized protein BDZ99DRAFT_474437 [Mytilinidion resinicola]KAF2812232.1 hypothetical protein BDZ99DRAFT_474437 [Mytilinidion resinicola]